MTQDESGAPIDVLAARLMGALVVQGKNLADGAPILARLGMTNRDIAAVFNATEGAVRTAIGRERKKGSAA